MASAPSLHSDDTPDITANEESSIEPAAEPEETTATTEEPAPKVSRLEWIDAFRGLAIVAVAAIHTIGSGLSVRHPPDTSWYCMIVAKTLLQFAVPAFLMLSSLVLMRSLLRDASPGRYIRNRLQTVLWPTIIWTLLCIPYAHWLRPDFTWEQTAQRVWEGTAQFHLYFLRVLLQLCLFLPLLLPFARRRPPFWKVLPLTVVTTLACFFANRYYWHITTPASWLFWYVPSIMMGVWLATQTERWASIARRGPIFACPLLIGSGAMYLGYALHEAEGGDPRSVFYPISQWVFVSSATFLLFSMTVLWCERRKRYQPLSLPMWRLLGQYSLQIYLIHPGILAWLQRVVEPHFVTGFISFKLLLFLLCTRLILCIILPFMVAKILEKCRVSAFLFGR